MPKIKSKKLRLYILICGFISLILVSGLTGFAQEGDLEYSLDFKSAVTPLPKIFKPAIDLSGRGFHREVSWPQQLASREALDIWQNNIGFNGIFRMQYNLWETNELSKDSQLQTRLLANYESVIKGISDAGGIVILDLFGTPAGLGKVLDKKSPPWDLKAFKELVKGLMRELSCLKKYNIWYEVWNAPDLDDFFLGRRQEYLNLYRVIAESARELEKETKVHIPVGGPSVTSWFQNTEANTVITPERSLIYELIKYCYHYRLPLDFISWHSYTTDPRIETQATIYKNKSPVNLIRDWLSYFHFDKNTPLIIDEWNYDRNANILPERSSKSYISASFILPRIKNMHETGINYQLYFCLEDFKENKEGVVRNAGIFSFDPEYAEYKGSPKAAYNIYRMLKLLGNELFTAAGPADDFVGGIATKNKSDIALLVYNYVDPEIAVNYLSRNIASLTSAQRRVIIETIRSEKLQKIIAHKLEIASLRADNKVKNLLKKAQALSDAAKKLESQPRNLKLTLKNLKKSAYSYSRYIVDSSCSLNCAFLPAEEKELEELDSYQETLSLSPYSVQLILLKSKPMQ